MNPLRLSTSPRISLLPHTVNASLSSLNPKIERLSVKSLTEIALSLCFRCRRTVSHLWLGFRRHRMTTIITIGLLNPNIEQLSGKGLQPPLIRV